MKHTGVSKMKLLICLCLAALLCGAGYYAWWWGWPEYHAQRLDDDDQEVARSSEVALLALGERGRGKLYDFLLNKLNIELPLSGFESGAEPQAQKIIAVSKSGEVEVAGALGAVPDVVLLSDSSAPFEKVCRPLAELARTGTVSVLAIALTSDSQIAVLEIDLVFLSRERREKQLTLKLAQAQADLAGAPVCGCSEVEAALDGRAAGSVEVVAGPGVDYGRFLEFASYLHAARRRPVLVFGDAGAFGAPSANALEELSRGLNAPDGSQQGRAAGRLKTAMGELFTYDTSKTPARNRAAIENWSKWFQKNKSYIYFDAVAGSYAYDAAASAAGVGHQQYWLEKLRILKNEPENSNDGKEEKR